MKGSEFLVKEPNLDEVFVYEDFNEEQMMMYKATKDFIHSEILTNIEKIENNPDLLKTIKVKKEKDINKYREFDIADIILFDTPSMEKSLEFPKYTWEPKNLL